MGLPTPPGEAAKGMQCTPTQAWSQPENGKPQHQGPGPCTQREEAWNSLEHKELRSGTNSVTRLPRRYPEHLLPPQTPTCSTCQVSNSNPTSGSAPFASLLTMFCFICSYSTSEHTIFPSSCFKFIFVFVIKPVRNLSAVSMFDQRFGPRSHTGFRAPFTQWGLCDVFVSISNSLTSAKMHSLAEVGICQLNHVDRSLPQPLNRCTRPYSVYIVLSRVTSALFAYA